MVKFGLFVHLEIGKCLFYTPFVAWKSELQALEMCQYKLV